MDDKEFREKLANLIDLINDRLDEPDRDQIREYDSVGEWPLAVNLIAATLVQDHTPIAPREQDILRDLLYFYELPVKEEFINNRDEVLILLNVVEDGPSS